MKNIIEKIYEEAFEDEFQKEAKLRLGDIEDQLGTYLPDEMEGNVRKLMDEQTKKRFMLRNPLIGGLTLGIGPAISKHNAVNEIVARMARKEPEFRNMINKERERKRAEFMEERRLEVESEKANQLPNTLMASATALPLIIEAIRSRKESQEDDD